MSARSQKSSSSITAIVRKGTATSTINDSGKKSYASMKRRGRPSQGDGLRWTSIEHGSLAVSLVDFPQLCTEYGATVIPEIMISDSTGKLLPSRGREAQDRRSRRSRVTSPSVTSSSFDVMPTGSALSGGNSQRSSVCGEVDDALDTPSPVTSFVIITFQDDKKKENPKFVTFQGFLVEEAHIKALGRCLPLLTSIDTIKFKKCHIFDKRIQHLSSVLHYAENLVTVEIQENPGPEEGYHSILQECKKLQYLLLRSCMIDNNGAKLLADELASRNESLTVPLLYLNLSTNMIEDEGATALAKALRTNRVLTALTLSGNYIGDDGALELADALHKFQLSEEEVAKRKEIIRDRMYKYIEQMENVKEKDAEPRPQKGRNVKTSKTAEGGSKIQISDERDVSKHVDEEADCSYNPLMKEVWPDGGKLWCAGNLHLSHLNLSFNRINTLGAQRFLRALCYQVNFKRNVGSSAPTGLVNLVLHGNPIPINWPEWPQMREILSQISGKPIAQRYADLLKSYNLIDSEG